MSKGFEFLKGNIEVIILNALFAGDKYGYEIAKEIKEKTESAYEIKQPTMYAYLKRLEMQGLISPYWGEESSGGRRKYYSLTQDGIKLCESFTSEWKYQRDILNTLVPDSDVAPMTQKEATPLFGSKVKRIRSKVAITDEDLEKQIALAKKLASLSKGSNEPQPITSTDIGVASDHDHTIQSQDSPSVATRSVADPSSLYYEDDVDYPTTPEAVRQLDYLREQSQVYSDSIATYEEPVTQKPDSFSQASEGYRYQSIPDLDNREDKTEYVYDEATLARDKDKFFEIFEKRAQAITEKNNRTYNDSDLPTHETPNIVQQIDDAKKEIDIQGNYGISPTSVGDTAKSEEVEKEYFEQTNTPETDVEKNYKLYYGDLLGAQLDDDTLRRVSSEMPDESVASIATNPVVLEELAESFGEQGIRMKIFNRTTADYVPQTMLFANKLNCAASWLTYALIISLMVIVELAFVKYLPLGTLLWYVLTPIVLPIAFSIIFYLNPNKKKAPSFDFRYHLINTVIAVGLAVVLIFALNVLLAKIVFSNITAVMTQIVMPIILCLGVPLYVISYKLLFNKSLTK